MEPPREGFDGEQSTRRSRDRLRRSVSVSQSSGGSFSTPFDEGTGGTPEPARPSTYGRRPSMSDWVGAISQAMATIVGPSFSSHTGRLEAAQMMEIAKRLGAQEFRGTTDPTAAEEWLREIERIFGMMDCPEERKVSIASFLLKGRALNWWESYICRQPQGVIVT